MPAHSRPASSISSTSGGAFVAVTFIASRFASSTVEMVNSPVSRIARKVSFIATPGRALSEPIPNASKGGSETIALKHENGAAFRLPFASTVTTHAIGRGVIVLTINL
jgi:hypothetical protein